MSERAMYLDTSSVVKRYVEERGSSLLDRIYANAEAGEHRIATSLWNVGEVLGVLDTYRSRKLIDNRAFQESLVSFLAESLKMIRLGSMEIIPVTADLLTETYDLILKHHIYQADALQVAACRIANCKIFLSADSRLLEVARGESLNAFNIERQEDKIRSLL